MKIPRIKTPFEEMSDPAFETKAGSIHDSMAENADVYPNPVPAMLKSCRSCRLTVLR